MAVPQGPGLINKYRPTALSFNSYGWKGSPLYNRADVPSQWVEGVSSIDRTVIEQQLAYEWLNSSDGGGVGVIRTNPPFLSGAAGRLMSGMTTSNGTSARILRGFIRRSEADLTDIASMSRLYFMYNPETITRDYVSYLDQGALDPFNTVFQSGNLVAPPSYMDFSFSLFFDRQEEAVIASNPGVFVDYQYFDMVVRNVIPATDPNSMNSTLPDNGVMMVNPRDITVVFSPQITVQGRPSNAQVRFTRFTHRMVPTRMEIDLTMRVTYFGPMKDMVPYVKDEAVTSATIPFTSITDTYQISSDDLASFREILKKYASDAVLAVEGGSPTLSGTTAPFPGIFNVPQVVLDSLNNASLSSVQMNSAILDFAMAQVNIYHTTYVHNTHTWLTADCSGLVYRAFTDTGYSGNMGWNNANFAVGTQAMWTNIANHISKGLILFQVDGQKSKDERSKVVLAGLPLLQRGDLLFRINNRDHMSSGHVAWFDKWDNDGKTIASLFAAQSEQNGVGTSHDTIQHIAGDYTGAFRPNFSSVITPSAPGAGQGHPS